MDSIGKVAGILISVVLLFFAPLLMMAQKQEMMMESYVFSKTAYLVEHIKSNGYLSKQMYEQYERQLSLTGFVYEIQMEHEHVTYYLDEEGRYQKQYQKQYEEDMFERIYSEEERYVMQRGDFFSLKVVSKSKGLAGKMKERLLLLYQEEPAIFVELGGMIRDETTGL